MYVSLHNRSAYSFGSALTKPKQLARFARQCNMPAIALTDLNGLYAAVAFQHVCRKAGVKPIIGVELQPAEQTTITLLAQSQKGYANLCRLVSLQQLRDKPIVDLDVREHADGLVCLIGRPSHKSGWEQTARSLAEAFNGRIYKELVLHCPEDARIARSDARLADELAVPVVASCESRCVRPDQAQTLRALSSIGTLTLLDQPHPDKPVGNWHLRTPQEMQHLFRRRPDALANTLKIAQQCNFQFELNKNRFPSFQSPDGRSAVEHLRELCITGCRRRYILEPPLRGIGGTRPTWTEVTQRLERELRIIEQVGYAEYFLVFHEIVEYCRRQNIDTLARGSAADSLACYALGVSHACPFRFDLPFDRFINAQRAKFSKLADIDLDLPWDRREQVIRWVYDRWGHDRVAMIGSANTYHTRAAVAELGKVFGLPPHEVHHATKRMRHIRSWNLAQAVAALPEAKDVPVSEEPYRTVMRLAGGLSGLPRHWAMHPCGLVVSPEPLTDLVPVQKSPKGFLVAQYDMDAIEDLGFIKIDLLGQAGLAVLRDAVAEIKRTEDRNVNLQKDVDYSDSATWEMIATGQARGVHHIESPAMTSLLQQCNCRDIDCLTAVVAIIRPGAANQGKKDHFARRYQGTESYGFVHPVLEPILEKTYGLMVFEEHILQVATEFAGLHLGTADVLRRALNKQNQTMIRQMKREFYASARIHRRSDEEIDAVWSVLEGFSGFMFNKAHSAEYAVEAFQGAWLKCRRPAHYIAAILSNYRGFYAHSPTLPQILYVLEAYRLGIGFLPPCVNRSTDRFSVEYVTDEKPEGKQKIRVPISHINGLSQKFIKQHLAKRERGAFVSLQDFIERCRPSETEARLLLDAGALDDLGHSRPQLFWQMRTKLRDALPGQPTLWQNLKGVSKSRTNLALSAPLESERCSLPNWCGIARATASREIPNPSTDFEREAPAPAQRDQPAAPAVGPAARAPATAWPVELTIPDAYHIAQREMELLGFPITIDPLTHLGTDEHGRRIDWSRYVPTGRLKEFSGKSVQVCGLMVADRINATQQGQLMKFVSLADRSGVVETILFPDVYQRFGYLTAAHPILAARGIVKPFENRNGLPRGGLILQVQQVSPPHFTNGP